MRVAVVSDIHGNLTALEAVIGGAPRPGQLRRYELALLTGLGLLPALVDCCACGEPVAPEPGDTIAFDAVRGGVLCLAHGRGAPRLPVAVLAVRRERVGSSRERDIDRGTTDRSSTANART